MKEIDITLESGFELKCSRSDAEGLREMLPLALSPPSKVMKLCEAVIGPWTRPSSAELDALQAQLDAMSTDELDQTFQLAAIHRAELNRRLLELHHATTSAIPIDAYMSV